MDFYLNPPYQLLNIKNWSFQKSTKNINWRVFSDVIITIRSLITVHETFHHITDLERVIAENRIHCRNHNFPSVISSRSLPHGTLQNYKNTRSKTFKAKKEYMFHMFFFKRMVLCS